MFTWEDQFVISWAATRHVFEDKAVQEWLFDRSEIRIDRETLQRGVFSFDLDNLADCGAETGASKRTLFVVIRCSESRLYAVAPGVPQGRFFASFDASSRSMIGFMCQRRAKDGQLVLRSFRYEGRISFGAISGTVSIVLPSSRSLKPCKYYNADRDCNLCAMKNVPCFCPEATKPRTFVNVEAQNGGGDGVDAFQQIMDSVTGVYTLQQCCVQRDGNYEAKKLRLSCVRLPLETYSKWHRASPVQQPFPVNNEPQRQDTFLESVQHHPEDTLAVSQARSKKGNSEDNPFKCSLCTSSFKFSYRLKRHIEGVHQHQRKYECKRCCRRFTQNAHLQMHEKMVHATTVKLQCPMCDAKFSWKTNLKRHIRCIHEAAPTGETSNSPFIVN